MFDFMNWLRGWFSREELPLCRDPKRIAKIIAFRKLGLNIPQIAAKMRYGETWVRAALKANAPELAPQVGKHIRTPRMREKMRRAALRASANTRKPKHIAMIIDLRKRGLTISQIGAQVGYEQTRVWRLLKANAPELADRQYWRRHEAAHP